MIGMACVLMCGSCVCHRFKMFTRMDDDKSGKITYTEFADLCREELKLSKSVDAAVAAGIASSALDIIGLLNRAHAAGATQLVAFLRHSGEAQASDWFAGGKPETGAAWQL